MNPFEYMAMDSEEMYLINALKTAFMDGKQEAREERTEAVSSP